jgi:hypothetical protein
VTHFKKKNFLAEHPFLKKFWKHKNDSHKNTKNRSNKKGYFQKYSEISVSYEKKTAGM